MPIASKLCGMLARACAFPVGIPAYKVDPEVKKTIREAAEEEEKEGGLKDRRQEATAPKNVSPLPRRRKNVSPANLSEGAKSGMFHR